jgi:D-hexose-6-phosphate mutarotase
MAFTCALHTYFNVATIDKTQVIGLKGSEYEDSADGGKVKQEVGFGPQSGRNIRWTSTCKSNALRKRVAGFSWKFHEIPSGSVSLLCFRLL